MRAPTNAAIAPPALFVGVFWGLVMTCFGAAMLFSAVLVAQAI